MKHYNVCYPRPYTVNQQGQEVVRTEFVKIGRAFALRDKPGFRIELYTMPVIAVGPIELVMLEADERGSRGRR